MWAAIKSDFKEFVSTAAEETNAVTNVVVNKASEGGGGSSANKEGGTTGLGLGGAFSKATGAVSSAASKATSAASNISVDVKGLGNMIGGVVAPSQQVTQSVGSHKMMGEGDKNASALLASDDEEEELGWDDDEDDLEIEDMDAPKTSSSSLAAPVVGSNDGAGLDEKPDDDTKEILSALQSKLDHVEKERDELQIEHRKQTATLVELRSKVEEMEREKEDTVATSPETNAEEVQALQEEIASLKLQLETSNEHVVTSSSNNEENKKMLEQCQHQIAQLKSELESLQSKHHESEAKLVQADKNMVDKEADYSALIENQEQQLKEAQATTANLQMQLEEMEKSHASSLQELAVANTRIAELEQEATRLTSQMEEQAVNFAATLEDEVEKTRRETEAAMNTSAPPAEEAAVEDEAEISSGEKINVDDSFVTAGEILSPKLKENIGDGDEDDWGDEGWGEEDD